MLSDERLLQDHDLLIGISENLKLMIKEFQEFKGVQAVLNQGLDGRVRELENIFLKLSPIPSVSHLQVVNDIATMSERLRCLENGKLKLMGGWKAIAVIAGSLLGVLSFIATILRLFIFHF